MFPATVNYRATKISTIFQRMSFGLVRQVQVPLSIHFWFMNNPFLGGLVMVIIIIKVLIHRKQGRFSHQILIYSFLHLFLHLFNKYLKVLL